ncbi:hypothetical protein K378_04949 [Streptomyces sp. Amel2xB2]|nr:hypothetical protein K378_04949 [Streptomyces sp. Amel2xB2]
MRAQSRTTTAPSHGDPAGTGARTPHGAFVPFRNAAV